LRKMIDCVPCAIASQTGDHPLKPMLSIFRTAN